MAHVAVYGGTIMLILVHGNGFNLDRELRDDVATKMETCFDRFSSRIGRVHVYLADLNGPKKGIDKSIRLVIDVEREPVIVHGNRTLISEWSNDCNRRLGGYPTFG